MGFLQLTPENIAQARNLSYPEAYRLDKTLGYQKNFPGGVGRVKYGLEGLKSIFGFGDQKIGGATPLTRKIALDAMDLGKKGINLAGKFLSKASLPLSILTPTTLGSSELTEEDRQNMMKNNNMSMGIMNPELLNQFDNITNTGVNQRPRLTDRIKTGIETVGNKLGSVGDYIKGGGIIGQALQGLGNAFEYRGGIGYVDEYGNFISAEDIDKQNARGGYYTDIARASRRRDKTIAAFIARGGAKTPGGQKYFEKLLAQQAKEEKARQDAMKAMAEANRAAGTGGYQAGYSDDFMTGGGSQRDEEQESRSPGSSGPGGSDTMGSS